MKLVYNPEGENKPSDNTPHTLQGENVREESKDQRQKMKDKPFKEKALYYIEYYKFTALAVAVIAAIVISITMTIINAKDNAFCAMIVNSILLDETKLSDSFSEYSGIDTDEYLCAVSIDSTGEYAGDAQADVAVSSRFAALISSKDLDIMVYNSADFELNAMNECCADLREVLSAEDFEKYKDIMYYVDYAEIRKRAESDEMIALDYTKPTAEEIAANLEEHMNPDKYEEPIPVGIVIKDSPMVVTTECYPITTPVLGIAVNTQRLDKAIDFIHYIFDKSVDFKAIMLEGLM